MRFPGEVLVFLLCLGYTCTPYPGPARRRQARHRRGRVCVERWLTAVWSTGAFGPWAAPAACCVAMGRGGHGPTGSACCAMWAGSWESAHEAVSPYLFFELFERSSNGSVCSKIHRKINLSQKNMKQFLLSIS
jgi:hypothetical protein